MDNVVISRLSISQFQLPVLSVEPIAIFMFLGFHLWLTSFQTGLYQVVCYQLYHNPKYQTNNTLGDGAIPLVDCTSKIADVSIQNRIQQKLSFWFMLLMLAYIVPGMISSCILGAWSDKTGRKINLLLCTAGLIVSIFPLSFIFTFKFTSLWILLVFHVLGGSTGFLGLLLTSAMAYLSDISLDRKEMTIRMVMFSVLASVAGVVGALLSGALLGRLNTPVLIVIVECLFSISFFYILFRLDHLPPTAMKRKMMADKSIDNNKEKLPTADKTATSKNNGLPTKTTNDARLSVLGTIKQLIKEIVRTYTKQRPDKQRTFLIISALILFLHMMADTGLKGNIVGQYVLRDPFNWIDGSQLGYWRAANSVFTFVGNVIGIVVFKKLLKFSDTLIMLISILSGMAELIVLGVSSASWMLYLAIFVGCLNNLLMPVMASFTTQLVGTDEVGKSFVAHGLASSLAFMASTVVFQQMYKATLEMYAGFVFLFGACMMAVCFFVILWIHVVDVRRTQKVIDVSDADMKIFTVQSNPVAIGFD